MSHSANLPYYGIMFHYQNEIFPFRSYKSIFFLSASSGVRPFGVSLLIAGWDEDHPYLFQSDPSVRLITTQTCHIHCQIVNLKICSHVNYAVFTMKTHVFMIIFVFCWQGAYFAWKATAMGKNYVNGKTFLEKR